MLRRTLGLALTGLLLLPAAGLAADPVAPPNTPPVDPPPTGHAYVVEGIERAGTATKIQAKLWIEGDQLGVSVGCNTIGAAASFDGTSLRLTGPLSTTEMACPADLAPVEAALVAALGAGPFTYDGSAFNGTGVRILAAEIGTGPATPPDAGVIVDPGVPFDPTVCKDLVTPEEWAAVFGAGGASDSASGSGGTSFSPGVVAPGVVPGSAPGTVGATASSATPGSAPGDAGVSGAGSGPAGIGGAGGAAFANPAGPQAVPPATGVAPPPPVVDLPFPTIAGGKAAPLITPAPAATPNAELCRQLLSRIQATASNGMAMPKSATDAPMELGVARDAAATRVPGGASFVLVLALGVLLIAWLRSVAGRPSPGGG